ncbi:MAG: MFS transporter [Alphaproteobacteria bacterium]|nr:MFS transporter [Alphaproteobacteria bacterium]
MLKVFLEIPNTIKVVGCVSFLINASTLMIFSLFGLYLHDRLHIDFSKIGFLDGAIEASSFIMKIFSGIVSDFLMNRKCIFLLGAICLFVAKPLEAIATNYWPLFQAKILERIGNGLQSTPRDAIVGDWAPKECKATCFGLRQSLAALGAVIGSIMAAVLMKSSNNDYQFVFWMATIPSFLSVLLIVFFVKDKKQCSTAGKSAQRKYRKITFSDIRNLGTRYWILIGVACSYMVAKVSESIVILHIVSTLQLPEYMAPMCMICYQLASSFISLPAGMISDKIKSRENLFITGITVFLLSDLLFIFGNSVLFMVLALVCLGSYIGVTQSIFPAKIIDIVPADLKGTGIGIFNLACALSLFAGGIIFGHIADAFSLRHAFIASSGFAVVSLIVLLFSKRQARR